MRTFNFFFLTDSLEKELLYLIHILLHIFLVQSQFTVEAFGTRSENQISLLAVFLPVVFLIHGRCHVTQHLDNSCKQKAVPDH